MRLALDPRARRLLRRMPRTTVYSAMELLLLALLAVQCARLAWMIVTPVGPVGDWRANNALRSLAPASTNVLGAFDPFFRLDAASGPIVVTSLDLKLFGVREDRASGRGSAIISTPDGEQRSFAVGDEILPGVTLAGVAFDSVTISRAGTAEQLFLDQSDPAPVVTPTPSTPEEAAAPAEEGAAEDILFLPRMSNGGVAGVTVQGGGDAFRAAGFAPGDIIVAVNGQRIVSAEQAEDLAEQVRSGEATFVVERGGRDIPIRAKAYQ